MEWDDESQMIFTDPVVIEKAERECGENPLCLELKSKIMKSIEEQNNIVNNLEKSLKKIDKLIENNNKKNKLLTELKNSSYKSYF